MSAKPWEQDWKQDPNSPDFVVDVGPRYATVAKAMALWSMDVATHQQVTGELAKFIAAAPRLYRALEALLDAASIDKTAPEFIEARAALKAARGEE